MQKELCKIKFHFSEAPKTCVECVEMRDSDDGSSISRAEPSCGRKLPFSYRGLF